MGRSRVTHLQLAGSEITRSIPSSDPPSSTRLHAKWGDVEAGAKGGTVARLFLEDGLLCSLPYIAPIYSRVNPLSSSPAPAFGAAALGMQDAEAGCGGRAGLLQMHMRRS